MNQSALSPIALHMTSLRKVSLGVNLMPFLFYVSIFIERTMAVHHGLYCDAV